MQTAESLYYIVFYNNNYSISLYKAAYWAHCGLILKASMATPSNWTNQQLKSFFLVVKEDAAESGIFEISLKCAATSTISSNLSNSAASQHYGLVFLQSPGNLVEFFHRDQGSPPHSNRHPWGPCSHALIGQRASVYNCNPVFIYTPLVFVNKKRCEYDLVAKRPE